MGLWAAVLAERAGLTVTLVEAGPIGGGASGGVLGALMAHMPDRWNDKKQFQFDALITLEAEIARLEAETGLKSGYRRSGRLIPLPKPHLKKIALGHQRDAAHVWREGERVFEWRVLEASPFGSGWPDSAFTQGGLVFDTLAARVFPRTMTALLLARLRQSPRVRLIEGVAVRAIETSRQRALLADGRDLAFGHAILAGGVETFSLLEPLRAEPGRPLGMGVKGQAALLEASIDPALPLLYLDGLYVVPHENGQVAVGSTSENQFADPFSTDAQLDLLIERARALVPALANAPVAERWAGLRPKAIDRDPMVGPLPGHPAILALTGGFKVSFGIAHRLAAAALGAVTGVPQPLPETFTLAHHLDVSSRKR